MKITSGRWVARYSIADSAFSALSTSSSYFSRIRARKRRADLESSTINAHFAAMAAPIQHPEIAVWMSLAQNVAHTIAVASARRMSVGEDGSGDCARGLWR